MCLRRQEFTEWSERHGGRAEIMTSRRPGYAHLDVNPVVFDAYKCHTRNKTSTKSLSNLCHNFLPKHGSEIVIKKTKQVTAHSAINSEDHLGNNGHYMVPKKIEGECEFQPNYHIKRKIIAPWTRSEIKSLADRRGALEAERKAAELEQMGEKRGCKSVLPPVPSELQRTNIRILAQEKKAREETGVSPDCLPAGISSYPKIRALMLSKHEPAIQKTTLSTVYC
eukprot:Selendium_serpulae@DN3596_c0_g1_i3.p2